MTPNILIDPELLRTFPEIRLGCISYTVQVHAENPALWTHLEKHTIPALMQQLEELTLAGIEGIRCSREAYKAFGRSPSRYRVSSESLIRRIRQGNALYHVNTIVDVNNLISLETALSVGSYDLKHLQGNVTLSLGRAGEGYEGIGKNYIDMEKMLLLRDELGPFGSPTSDSHRAMIGSDSQQILTVIYCFSDRIDLDAALQRGADQLHSFANAENIRTWIVR